MEKRFENSQSIEFSGIDDLPSTKFGEKMIYDRSFLIYIMFEDSKAEIDDISTKGEPDTSHPEGKSFDSFKIDISTENDIFFYYESMIDEKSYQKIKQDQELKVSFQEYATICLKTFNKCEFDSKNYIGIMTIKRSGTSSKFQVFQKDQYKNIELLNIDFEAVDDEDLKTESAERFNQAKSQLTFMENRLINIISIIQQKNPSLLSLIQKQSHSNMKNL